MCHNPKTFSRRDRMKALILSGGTGTRLRPLTYSQAKQLIPVANKPILFYIIEKVAAAGIKDIGIIVGDTYKEIMARVGSGDRWNVNITYIPQPDPLGLAHAVKTASQFLMDSDFLMILGDNLFQMRLDKIIEEFYSNRPNASILLHRVENPSGFGVAVVENGQITKVVEKPGEFISNLIITGIYIFDHSIFNAIDRIRPSPRGELEITDAIQKLLDTGGKVTYSLTEGWWKDTGSPYDILEANRRILEDSAASSEDAPGENTTIEHCVIHNPVRIGRNSTIINSSLGPFVSIGSNVTVENCTIQNSIILDNSCLKNVGKLIVDSLIGRSSIVEVKNQGTSHVRLLVGDLCEIII